jgi:hypothetical protein
MDDIIQRLEVQLREKHPDFYAGLRRGRESAQMAPSELRALYSWRDGQEGEAEFLRHLRFLGLDEAAERVAEAKRGTIFQKILSQVFAGRILRSYPLLVDISGGGYYFDPRQKNVFLAEEGEKHQEIGDVDRFLGLWMVLAAKTDQAMDDDLLVRTRINLEND